MLYGWFFRIARCVTEIFNFGACMKDRAGKS